MRINKHIHIYHLEVYKPRHFDCYHVMPQIAEVEKKFNQIKEKKNH